MRRARPFFSILARQKYPDGERQGKTEEVTDQRRPRTPDDNAKWNPGSDPGEIRMKPTV